MPYFENLVCHVSVITILAISFERYYAICRPFKRIYACSKTRAVKIIAAIWLVGALCTFPFIVMSYVEKAKHTVSGEVDICRTSINTAWKQIYVIATVALLFLLPFLILVVLYIRIGKRLVQDEANLNSEYEANRRFVAARKQVVYMLIAIILFFFICLVPIRVFILWYVFSPIESKDRLGHEQFLNILSFARTMMFVNSAGNPILYNIVSSKFREACMKTLGCRRPDIRRCSMSTYNGGSSVGCRRGTNLSEAINFNLSTLAPDRSVRNEGLLGVTLPHNMRPRNSWDYVFYSNDKKQTDRLGEKRCSL